ncbi:MAG: U32 family peptidase [Clostridia bacterium]|nr:U32 family peptidase [Clostridia bacterium]
MTAKANKLPELLSPAGSPEALKAALRGGADAVYIGGKSFNARMNAANFDGAAIERAAADCHAAGARLYVTLNTLILEREYKAALDETRGLWNAGVDALIVADLGLAREIRLNFPGFELHASTQAGVHSADGARALSSLGFSRVVCARELSKENIRAVIGAGVEVEMFIHGALCVCHSGQCLFSSLVGGRSGNRGECAQPCRLGYNGSYPLSLKDSCLAGHVREIIELAPASLKIEGRMKSPDYVYGVTSTWRGLLDAGRDATEREIDGMARVFSRGGFTDGYFTGRINGSMNGVRSEEDKRRTREGSPALRSKNAPRPQREPLTAGPRGDIEPVLHPVDLTLPGRPYMTARFYDPAAVPKDHPFDIIYLPLDRYDPEKANGVVLPPVVTDAEKEKVSRALREAADRGCKYALVGNAGQFGMAKEAGLEVRADFRMGAYSAEAAEALYSLGAEEVVFSPELTVPQLRDIKAPVGAIVYGRIPLMLLEKRLGARELRDRRGARFPVVREGGRDVVLNSAVTYMADRKADLDRAHIIDRHFIFTTETPAEVTRVIRAYLKGEPAKPGTPIRRIR